MGARLHLETQDQGSWDCSDPVIITLAAKYFCQKSTKMSKRSEGAGRSCITRRSKAKATQGQPKPSPEAEISLLLGLQGSRDLACSRKHNVEILKAIK